MRLIVYLGNYQTAQSYLSSSTMCYPKWASRSAGNVLQINQHLNEAVGTVWRRGLGLGLGPNPARSNRTLVDLCASLKSTLQRGGAHMCHRQAHNGLFIGSPGDAIHTKHPLQDQDIDRHLPQSRASLMAF